VGFVVQEAPGRVSIGTPTRRAPLAVVPEAALRPGVAIKRGETTLAPLDELARAGVCTVEVLEQSQQVVVHPRP